MGRPKLLYKDGYHSHSGYSRWHAVDQSHGNKTSLLHKEDDGTSTLLKKNAPSDSSATEIYNLVLELERREMSHLLIEELQKSIETLLNDRKPTKELSRARKAEQESIGKDEDEAKREPNTYGLP